MYTRIFCQHCDSYYEVDIEEARLVEKFHDDWITFVNNTYYYKNKECFFLLVKKLKKTDRTKYFLEKGTR